MLFDIDEKLIHFDMFNHVFDFPNKEDYNKITMFLKTSNANV